MSFLKFLHTRLGILLWTAAMIACGSCATTHGQDQYAAIPVKSGKACTTADKHACRSNDGAIKWSRI
ncbi:MAG: hypothetical protein ABI171_01065 [Collimonas sp.]|uniref:hypothetical protein n=1 Tax=Collimonas sp. TaxID=1963772 RepID=UPI003265617D